MAGLAASALLLAGGPSPLRLRNPAPVCGLTRPPLLKVAKPQSFVRPRFAQASRRKFTAAASSGRQGLRTSQYQFDDDEPLWLAVLRECAAGLRSFVAFLADQPRQLKHLEWPGFQNTVAKPQSFVRPRFAQASRRKFTAASSSGRQGLRTSQYQFDDDEPLWLAVVRECAAGLRSFVAFLADQPRQLKHLEWPGFQNTLRTATLTLILVAVFIVALSSVDAALSYILSWLLRKSA